MTSPTAQNVVRDQDSDSDEHQDITSPKPPVDPDPSNRNATTMSNMLGSEGIESAKAKKRTVSSRSQPLSIILVNEPHQGQTSEQRREVRSNAMRDYHKRMKQDRQMELPKSSPVAPRTAKQTRHSMHDLKLSQLRPTSPTLNSGRNDLFIHPSGLPEFDRWQYNTSTPYALCMGSGAPTLYMQAKRWPFVRHACGATPGISLWMPEMSIPIPSAYAQRPCLLKSVKTVSWISSSLEYLEFKGETVKWINNRLQDTELGPSDSTIGIIMCLANWEIARGSAKEVEQHMDGIQKIVQLRGGINSLATVRHFQTKIALLDVIVAVLHNGKARFPSFYVPRPYIPPSPIQGLDMKPVPDSPLYGIEPLDRALAGSPFGVRGVQILQKMRDMTDRLFERARYNSSEVPDLLTRDEENALPEPIASDFPTSDSSHMDVLGDDYEEDSLLPHLLLTPIIHAAKIYTDVVSPFLTSSPAVARSHSNFSWRQNPKNLEGLVQALQFPRNDATFTQYPGVLVWILLVGAIAAEERPERGFLVMFLTKIGTGSEHGWWDEMRDTVEKFQRVREIVG